MGIEVCPAPAPVHTIPAFIEHSTEHGGSISDASAELDVAQLRHQSLQVAGALQHLGLRAGERLAILVPNCAEWFVLHIAASILGVVTIPLNTRYTRTEIAKLLRTSEARALAIAPGFLGLDFTDMVHELVDVDRIPLDVIITVGRGTRVPAGSTAWSSLLDGPKLEGGPPVTEDTPLVVFGTSGTTSSPKLALHHHGGVVRHAAAVAAGFGLRQDDVVLGLLPPCGAYGYTVAMAALAAGARLVLLPTFSPVQLPRLISTYGITFLAATEAILRPALAAGGSASTLRTWRLAATAGVSVGDVVTAFDQLDVSLVNVYGASELLALYAFRDPRDSQAVRSTPGGRTAHPELEVRAADPDTGVVLDAGTSGELQFRGYCVFSGYLGNPDATAAAFTPDGWYRSGDHGRVWGNDARSFDYLSRLTDTMRLKGFLVDPAQIEETMLGHPAVREAQVVGVPDDTTGEDTAVAFVVVASEDPPEEEALRSWCSERLAGFKIPARIAVVAEIPVTPSANGDKVLKRALREMAVTLLRAGR